MRTPINCLLVNLAIADIMYAAFIAPEVILRIAITHPDGLAGTFLCKLVTAAIFAWIGAFSSMVTLLVIAFERYFAVIYPYENRRLTTGKLKKAIAGSWIFAVIINLPLFVVVTVKDNTCVNIWVYGENWKHRAYDMVWNSAALLTMVLMAGLYSRIVYTLWFKRDVHDNQLAFQQRGVIRMRKRATLMVVTVTVLFGICWVSDITAHSIDYYTSHRISTETYLTIHTLILLNTAVNPFVYTLISHNFREKMKGMIYCRYPGSTDSWSPTTRIPPSRRKSSERELCPDQHIETGGHVNVVAIRFNQPM